MTTEDSNARNGWRRQTVWKTSKMVQWHIRLVQLYIDVHVD